MISINTLVYFIAFLALILLCSIIYTMVRNNQISKNIKKELSEIKNKVVSIEGLTDSVLQTIEDLKK